MVTTSPFERPGDDGQLQSLRGPPEVIAAVVGVDHECVVRAVGEGCVCGAASSAARRIVLTVDMVRVGGSPVRCPASDDVTEWTP